MCTVIIYQMGKVGSSTLKESLIQNNIKALHIHRYYFRNNEKPIGFKRFIHKVKSNLSFDFLTRKKKVKIITLYRDPLSRNISSFFQNLDIYFSSDEMNNLTFNKLEEKFNSATNLINTPINWFDIEFNKKLNINIFDQPFDQQKGYSSFSKNNIDFFVCTTEKINNLEKEIGEFLEIENFKIIKKNIGSEKFYAPLYKEFKERYKPPMKMLDCLYNSKAIKYFYSKETILKFKNAFISVKPN